MHERVFALAVPEIEQLGTPRAEPLVACRDGNVPPRTHSKGDDRWRWRSSVWVGIVLQSIFLPSRALVQDGEYARIINRAAEIHSLVCRFASRLDDSVSHCRHSTDQGPGEVLECKVRIDIGPDEEIYGFFCVD